MKLGKLPGTDERIAIVAEIGNNHEGDFERAKKLVHAAAESGADAVKFQTYRTDLFISAKDKERYARLERWRFSDQQFRDLAHLARGLGLEFFSTPLDLQSLRLVAEIGCAIKIASGDNDFFPLIELACRSGKPVILSSGMTTLAALRQSVHHARSFLSNPNDVAVLHCVSSYPAPPEQANLQAIPVLQQQLGVTIGYSDHTLGIDACLAAAALGARILEKHFTLDKHLSDFRDHRLSADPPEMKELVRRTRAIEVLLGQPAKDIQPCETDLAVLARRSIVAGEDLPAGKTLSLEDLSFLRPAGGLSPSQAERVIGRKLHRSVMRGEGIGFDDLEP